MNITEVPVDGYERVIHFVDDEFSAYIAIHNIRLGPALGGCRVKKYSGDQAALQDALDLSKAMSYKNSLADLQFGGGKCVVNAPTSTPNMMRKVAEAVAMLNGDYVTAEDMGTSMDDLRIINEITPHVVHKEDGSPWTALGVYSCIVRLLDELNIWETPRLSVWLQGLGKVGWSLLERLHQHGGMLIHVSDVVSDRVEEAHNKFDAIPVMSNAYEVAAFADLYAPCAIGKVVTRYNAKSLPPIICGAANNQLNDKDELKLAEWLQQTGVVYVPDFLANAGGVIAAAAEINGDDNDKLERDVRAIADRMMHLFESSERENRTLLASAYMQAEARWQ